MKILLFKVGALGDILMTTPLIRQLRKAYPDAKIDYLVGKNSKVILENNKYIDEIITFEENIIFKKKLFSLFGLIKNIKRKKYDFVFVLDKHWIFNLISLLSCIKERIGFDRLGKEDCFLTKKVYYDQSKHDVLSYLDLLSKVAKVNYKDTKLDYFILKTDLSFAKRYYKNEFQNKKVICIAPGGGVNIGQTLSLKRWPAERFIELMKLLKKSNIEVLLIGGASDYNVGSKILKEVSIKSQIGVTLTKSAALLKYADAVLTNDSGPMHLAATQNDKLISVFGPTNPNVLFPLNGYKYIWKPRSCRPCYDVYGKYKKCLKNQQCMFDISAKEVFDIIQKAIK
jgi:lipopolysaccharide heptosyltransferase II